MDKKVKELIEAAGAWVAICMKQYPDSRFVDDKLVRVCAALSAFEDKDWIIEATAMLHRYCRESERNRDVKELCLIHAGKAIALHELLEKFGAKPKKVEDETPLPCPFCGAAPALIHKPEGPRDACSKIACVNIHCPAQPEICDDRRVVEVEDPKACKAVIISLWNKRTKC